MFSKKFILPLALCVSNLAWAVGGDGETDSPTPSVSVRKAQDEGNLFKCLPVPILRFIYEGMPETDRKAFLNTGHYVNNALWKTRKNLTLTPTDAAPDLDKFVERIHTSGVVELDARQLSPSWDGLSFIWRLTKLEDLTLPEGLPLASENKEGLKKLVKLKRAPFKLYEKRDPNYLDTVLDIAQHWDLNSIEVFLYSIEQENLNKLIQLLPKWLNLNEIKINDVLGAYPDPFVLKRKLLAEKIANPPLRKLVHNGWKSDVFVPEFSKLSQLKVLHFNLEESNLATTFQAMHHLKNLEKLVIGEAKLTAKDVLAWGEYTSQTPGLSKLLIKGFDLRDLNLQQQQQFFTNTPMSICTTLNLSDVDPLAMDALGKGLSSAKQLQELKLSLKKTSQAPDTYAPFFQALQSATKLRKLQITGIPIHSTTQLNTILLDSLAGRKFSDPWLNFSSTAIPAEEQREISDKWADKGYRVTWK